jgi:hypothetical protein
MPPRAIDGAVVMLSTPDRHQLVQVRLDRRAPLVGLDDHGHAREAGVSVWPTVSDSMLNARRRNSDATRFRTPGLFST